MRFHNTRHLDPFDLLWYDCFHASKRYHGYLPNAHFSCNDASIICMLFAFGVVLFVYTLFSRDNFLVPSPPSIQPWPCHEDFSMYQVQLMYICILVCMYNTICRWSCLQLQSELQVWMGVASWQSNLVHQLTSLVNVHTHKAVQLGMCTWISNMLEISSGKHECKDTCSVCINMYC